nr:hypothetical protein DGKKSRWO_DGKKSRWO_CDS_0082 [uncultured phage]CAI9752256.1 hypothetical protein CVNMHQAP_CVNMHQAP_CDS_0082 [uncultured phage]
MSRMAKIAVGVSIVALIIVIFLAAAGRIEDFGQGFGLFLFISVGIFAMLFTGSGDTTGNHSAHYEAWYHDTDLATGAQIAELKNLNDKLDQQMKQMKDKK